VDIRADLSSELGDDMARRASKSSTDQNRVAHYVARLRSATGDRAAFERELSALKSDPSASLKDIADVALMYRGGGDKPTSKKAALLVIEKRFLELIRNDNQVKQASKSRPW
jgi:hypothetical protein